MRLPRQVLPGECSLVRRRSAPTITGLTGLCYRSEQSEYRHCNVCLCSLHALVHLVCWLLHQHLLAPMPACKCLRLVPSCLLPFSFSPRVRTDRLPTSRTTRHARPALLRPPVRPPVVPPPRIAHRSVSAPCKLPDLAVISFLRPD
jgi:hypothetical protein